MVSSGVLILGRWDYQILKYILYTTKYHPNTRNYFRCLLLGGLVLRGRDFMARIWLRFFARTLNYQSAWDINLTTQIYDKSSVSHHLWTKDTSKNIDPDNMDVSWNGDTPKSSSHSTSFDHDLVVKQPWWLGKTHHLRIPMFIFSLYSPPFTILNRYQ